MGSGSFFPFSLVCSLHRSSNRTKAAAVCLSTVYVKQPHVFCKMKSKIIIGVDGYNQSITGEVTMTVTCAASDCHHVPLVIVKHKKTIEYKNYSISEMAIHKEWRSMGLYSDNFYSWLDAHNKQESSAVVMDAQQPFGKSSSAFMGDKFDEKKVVRESKGKENGGQFKTKPKTIEQQDNLSATQPHSKEDEGIKSYTMQAKKDEKGKWHEVKEDSKGKSTRNDHDSFGKKGKHEKWLHLPPPATKDKETPNLDSFKHIENLPYNLISEIPDELLYKRGAYHGDNTPKGTALYDWSRNGEPVSPEESYRLEGALREAGYSGALFKDYSDVKIRPDIANSSWQVASFKDKNGQSKQVYGTGQRDANIRSKAERVGKLYSVYDQIKDKIIEGVHNDDPRAWLAYFMMRTKVRLGSKSNPTEGRGATDLTKGDVSLSNDGETFYLAFNSKGRQFWHTTAKDKDLYNYLKKRKSELVGSGANGLKLFNVNISKFRDYLKEISIPLTGDSEVYMKPHDFRRLGATRVADEYLKQELQGVDAVKDRNKWEDRVCKAVQRAASHINDTPKVAFDAYILPRILFASSPSDVTKYFPALSEKEA